MRTERMRDAVVVMMACWVVSIAAVRVLPRAFVRYLCHRHKLVLRLDRFIAVELFLLMTRY